jgi:hypothetical protein
MQQSFMWEALLQDPPGMEDLADHASNSGFVELVDINQPLN